MQEQQESSPDLCSNAVADAEEQGEAKGMGMGEWEPTNAAASAQNRTLKCKKKMKKKNKMQEQQECPPNLDSMETAEEQGEAKGRGMEELEATDAAVSALNGAPKCKKKKMEKKNNTHEEQESLPVLDSTAAPEAEEQGEAKGRGMEEREATNALASVSLNGTPKCKKKKMKKKNKIQEQHESPPDLDSMAAAEAQEQGEAKEGGMEEQEATNAAASTLVGTPKCKGEETKIKDSVMLDKEATTTVCSASQGTPKRKKRKRKDKMQEQLDSQQASPVIAGVDKIMSNESENGCTDGLDASGHADVSMDPINGEDPSCALSNAKDTEVLVECSKNLQESSAGRKRRKRKRKWGSSSRGPGFSCESGGIVAEHSLDPSTLHDLSEEETSDIGS